MLGLGLASAIVAGFADAAPTGVAAADLAWRAAAGAVVPLAASRAKRWTWLLIAGTAGVAADGAVRVVALLALGAAVASTVADRRHRISGALVGALSINALVRLPDIAFHGAPTLIAAVATIPVLLSGYRYASRRGRHLARRTAIAAGAVLVLLCLVAAVALLMARSSLERGTDEAQAGLASARAGQIDDARQQFDRAGESLDRGTSILSGPWLTPTRLVPVVAQHVDAARELSTHGSDALDAAGDAAVIADDDALALDGGRVNLQAVADAEQPLADALAAIDGALAAIDDTASPWLLSPLTDRIDHLEADLHEARGSAQTAVLAAQSAPDMLGANGARTYLVLFTNPAETRFLGGFVGNWALMTADDGQLRLERSGRAAELSGTPGALDRTLSGPEDFLDRYGRYSPEVHLVNVTASPDFPTVGQVAAELFPQAGIGPIDGVVALDPAALAALLSLTGPVTIPQIDQPLDASELERFLLIEQYERFPDLDERETMLDSLISTAFDRFLSVSTPAPSDIAAAFDAVVAEERLLAWTPVESEMTLLERAGVLGRFPRPEDTTEVLSVRTANASANKLDVYLHREIVHDARIDPETGDYTATTSVALTNEAPPDLPVYVTGTPGVRPPRANEQFVSLYTPHLLERVAVDGEPVPVESQVELGWNVYSLFVVVPPGETLTIAFELVGDAPTDDHSLLWDAQPVYQPDDLRIEVRRGDDAIVSVERDGNRDVRLRSGGTESRAR